MKTPEADFHFPVLGFTPDREVWGFKDMNTLTSCGPRTLKNDVQIGMELADTDGRRWVVRSVRRTGRARAFIPWLVSALLSTRQSRIEQELDPIEPITLTEAQARVCAWLGAFPQDYGAEDETDPVFEQLLAEVRATQTIGAILDVVGLDSFMAY
ncbi:MAG: hypothetical protein ABW360_08580 [Phenylobacterium sp.]